jgi:hypothetical protein
VGPDHDSSQPRATTLGQQQHLAPPRGWLRGRHVARESDILQGINSGSRPHGKVPDPWIYSPDLHVGLGPPRVRNGPLEWDSDPPVWGPDRPQWGPKTLLKAQAGVRSSHVSRPALVCSGPIRIHSCSSLRRRPDTATWHTARGIKPTGGTWHDASGLRTPSHSLRIRRAPVHSTDRRRAQSTIRGPHSYSLLPHYSYGNCPSMQHGLRTSRLSQITHVLLYQH